MVIFYDKETKEIVRTEDNVMTPTLPLNMSLDDKISFFNNNGEGFICLPYEIGVDVWSYILVFNSNNEFVGLIPNPNRRDYNAF